MDHLPYAVKGYESARSVEAPPLGAVREIRRRFDEDFRAGAVRIVRETGRPIAVVARELGINEGTLGNRVAGDRAARGEDRRGAERG